MSFSRIKFQQTDSECIYFLKACCLFWNCPFDRIRKSRDPAELRSCDHATSRLGLYYFFDMLHGPTHRDGLFAVGGLVITGVRFFYFYTRNHYRYCMVAFGHFLPFSYRLEVLGVVLP
jgi:hypothetical protein